VSIYASPNVGVGGVRGRRTGRNDHPARESWLETQAFPRSQPSLSSKPCVIHRASAGSGTTRVHRQHRVAPRTCANPHPEARVTRHQSSGQHQPRGQGPRASPGFHPRRPAVTVRQNPGPHIPNYHAASAHGLNDTVLPNRVDSSESPIVGAISAPGGEAGPD
jgi:hypothetical protein